MRRCFSSLVVALGLWSFRLGTRDAAEVPIIKAMAEPARVEPEDPGGVKAAHQGLEVNTVLAGRPAPLPREAPAAAPEPEVLQGEDAAQGELVLAAPAILAAKVLGEDGDLPMPPQEETALLTPERATPRWAPRRPAGGPRPRNRPANLRRRATEGGPPRRRSRRRPRSSRRRPGGEAPRPRSPAAAPAAREVASVGRAPAGPARRLRQRGDHPPGLGPAGRAARDLLGAKNLYVERTTANARVFYRLRVAGFASAEQTRQMCEALRARGVDCIPVTLQKMAPAPSSSAASGRS